MELTEPAWSIGVDADRHRVSGEIAAHEIVVEVVAESHLRVARHLVIGVGTVRGDLQAVIGLADADRAELDARVPQCVGPAAQHLLHLLGARVGGEVEVIAEPAQQGVAHAAADEEELVARFSEHATQVAQDVAVPVQRNLRCTQQFGVTS